MATTAGNEQTKIAIPRKKIPANEEVYQRIAELKQRLALSDRASKLFRYDPDEPLHIIPKARNKGSDE